MVRMDVWFGWKTIAYGWMLFIVQRLFAFFVAVCLDSISPQPGKYEFLAVSRSFGLMNAINRFLNSLYIFIMHFISK